MSVYCNSKRRLLASVIAASMLATAVTPTLVWAQSADATLRGKGPADAEVTVKNVDTGSVRQGRTGKDGSYAIVGLRPGTYQVDAGPGTQKTVTLTVASTATLNLEAAPAAQNLGAVTVNATTLTEVTTSEVGASVSQRQIATIPQITRNFLEFADTVPGMVFTVQSNGNASLQAGGQSPGAINVYIDGVGQKNYVLASGLAGQNNTQGNPFPQLAIGEYKVITSNYKAEYAQISSAAVTAETKSGTNEFHGEVFGNYTNDSLRAETPAEQANGDKIASHNKEYGFAIGGPIVQDKAHFFFTYEGKEFNTPVSVIPGGPVGLADQLPASAKAQLGSASQPFNEDLYFGKIDWEPTANDRIEASAKYRDESAISGIGIANAASWAYDTINTDKRYDIRWDHSTDSWFNRLQANYEDAFYTATALNKGNGYVYTAGPNNNNDQILAVGAASPLATQNKGQKGPALQDDFTFNDLQWHGDHVVKMGVSAKWVKLTAQDSGEFNPQFFYDVTPDGTLPIPYKVQFPSPAPGLNPEVSTTSRQFGAYIQDDWTVDEHLTLNLGLRWDLEQTPSYLNYVTPANVVAAFGMQDPAAPAGQTYAQTLAKGGVNVNDYISTGNNRSAPKGNFQPRLGFSYDLNGDQAHVFHAGIGRSFDRNLYQILQLEQTKSVLSQPVINFPSALHPCVASPSCVPWDPALLNGLGGLQALVAGTTAGKEVDMITNHLKTPFADQFSLGMRNSFGEWNTDATVQRINSHDGLVFQLGNRFPNGAFWGNCNNGPNSCSQPWGNGIPGFGSMIIANNGLQTRTTQVLLSAEKPYTPDSHWSATIAYTYTDAKQNNDSQDMTDTYAFDEATIGQYPFIGSAVSRHRLVSTGTLDGPWGLLFAAKLTLATPIASVNLACYGADTPNGCVPMTFVPPGSHFLIGGKVFGYRDIDFQMTKNFRIYDGLNAYLRFDLLNAFNWNNYSDYATNFGSSGVLNSRPVTYNPIGNILGVPRTVKLTVGLRF
ncbi:TonB-dependent receptor [Dyella sp. Tek66A03]|uniref:TonB-dependent receptor n=1 Tax=Dyella sp. Tek66A03 TaxID=3458298 RepID=UPI00403E7B98